MQNHEVENRTWVAQEGHSLAVSHTADVDTIHLKNMVPRCYSSICSNDRIPQDFLNNNVS